MTTSTDPQATGKSDAALKRFERRVEIPMMALSLLFLVVLILPILDTHLSHRGREAVAAANIALWAVFAAEFLVRLVLAPYKLRFIWKNPLDVVIAGWFVDNLQAIERGKPKRPGRRNGLTLA